MGKKLEALAGSLVDNELAVKVKDSANQLWLASLGAYSITQAEGEKAFNALVKDGEIVQARTRKMADETIANVTDKAVSTWGKIERAVEDRVRSLLRDLLTKRHRAQADGRDLQIALTKGNQIHGVSFNDGLAAEIIDNISPARGTPRGVRRNFGDTRSSVACR